MAIDSLNISILTRELNNTLLGAKVTKIYQPERDEIHLLLYKKNTFRLLLSANASLNRIHLVTQSKTNPTVAPAFCMLLRKHLTNATLQNVQQMPYERVVHFTFLSHNELGYEQIKHLIFELTGKTANIILTDGDFVILDTLKKLPISMDTSRIMLAGAKYKWFEDRNLLTVDKREEIGSLLTNGIASIDILLRDNLMGVSVGTINEALVGINKNDHSSLNVQLVLRRLQQLTDNIANPQPNIVFQQGQPVEVYPFDFCSIKGEKKFFDTLNEAHEQFFVLKDRAMRFAQKSKTIHTSVKNAIARTEKKIGLQRQDLLQSQQCETFKIYGDLILANIHIAKGDKLITQNYYLSDCPTICIEMDSNKTPQQNAQAYYKKYSKLKSTREHTQKLLVENQQLLDYLYSVAQSLKMCDSDEELGEIYSELADAKILKGKQNAPTKKNAQTSSPLKFSVLGMTFYVGKNNAQNDFIVRKIAKQHDIWFHTHSLHSAHGLLVTQKQTPDEQAIEICAQIIAHYSEAKQSGKTVVDYTAAQHLSRPPKSPLGFVVYTVYNTILITPNPHNNLLL